MYLCTRVSVCVCAYAKAQFKLPDACSLPNMATGLHCAVSTSHAHDSTLTDVIPDAKKTVSINKQLP